MADSKISALTELSAAPASGDLLVLVDVSDTTMAVSGTDKKITYANLTSALTSGATTFATSQAQTFTNGIIGPTWKPASNSTTALELQNAGGTAQMRFDTTNSQTIINPAGTDSKGLIIGTTTMPALTSVYISNAFPTVAFRVRRASGGAAFDILNMTAENTTSSLSTQVASIGTYIDMNTSPTAPSLRYMYLSSLASPAYNNANLFLLPSGYIGVGSGNSIPTAWLDVIAGTTAAASLRVRAGTAPTTPVVGDIWNDGALSFYNADATTNAIVNHLRLSRDSTGTAAAGLGLGILAELESTTTSRQSAGRLTWEWGTATHASRAAKGKLTAYYTSTERDAITWTADSAGATVYVNPAGGGVTIGDTTSPSVAVMRIGGTIGGAGGAGLYVDPTTNAAAGTQYGLRILGNPANATDFIGLGIHGSPNFTNYRSSIWIGNESGRPGINCGYAQSVAAPEFGIILAGRLGIGTSSPQSILHGHDGSGGFLFVNRASVGGTLVTVIPNGTGDVAEKIFFVGWCTNSSPFSADVAPTTLTVSSSTTKTDGVNTLTIAVAADGSFTLQATAGAATWNVNLWVFWR